MKIDLSAPMLDREAPSRAPNPDGDLLRERGRAFDAAIREAAPTRAEPAPRENPDAEGEAAPGDEKAARRAAARQTLSEGVETKNETPDADTREADATQDGEPPVRPLHSLLGLLNPAAEPRPAAEPQADAEGEAEGDDTAMRALPNGAPDDEAEPGLVTGEKGRGLRLDVLRMETHFEPRQDGMILMEPEAAAPGEGARPAADLPAGKAETGPARSDAAALLAGLGERTARSADGRARVAGAEAPTASRTGAQAAAETGGGDDEDASAGVPMRFDEALAQLSGRGRTAGDGSAHDGARGERRGEKAREAASAATRPTTDVAPADKSLATAALPAAGTAGLGLAPQIADRMLEVLGEPATRPGSGSQTPANEPHLRMRAGGAALKTLTIQLKPEHLGTLDVSMRLTEGRLTVELAASRADTAVLLAEDRGALRQLLERAGFSLDDAAISVVAKDAQPNTPRAGEGASPGGDDTRRSDNPSGAPAGGFSRGEGGGGEGGRGEPRPSLQPGRAEGEGRETAQRSRSSTYL